MQAKNKSKSKFSGERMQNHPKSNLYIISFARYKFAKKFISKKDNILDIACGSGYGTFYLSKYCHTITGADIDPKIIAYCQNYYKSKRIKFDCILPNQTNNIYIKSFNTIVSFETLEHTKNAKTYLKQLKKYLKPNGTIILSTPNNFLHQYPPENKFHIKEYELTELYRLIKHIFSKHFHISVYGQQSNGLSNNITTQKISTLKSIIIILFKKIYSIDLQYLHLLQKIEHLEVYKKIGKLQRIMPFSPKIYKINIAQPFLVPSISLFVIKNQK